MPKEKRFPTSDINSIAKQRYSIILPDLPGDIVPLDISELKILVDLNFYHRDSEEPFLTIHSGKPEYITRDMIANFEDVSVEKGLDRVGYVNQDEISFTLIFTANSSVTDIMNIILYGENPNAIVRNMQEKREKRVKTIEYNRRVSKEVPIFVFPENKEEEVQAPSGLPFRMFDEVEIIARVTSGKLDRVIQSYDFRGIIKSIDPSITHESSIKSTVQMSIKADNLSAFDTTEAVMRESEQERLKIIDEKIIKKLEPAIEAQSDFSELGDWREEQRERLSEMGLKIAGGKYYTIDSIIKTLLEDFSETKWETEYMSFSDIVKMHPYFATLVYRYYAMKFYDYKSEEIIGRFTDMSSYAEGEHLDEAPVLGELLISADDVNKTIKNASRFSVTTMLGMFFDKVMTNIREFAEKSYGDAERSTNVPVKTVDIGIDVEKIENGKKKAVIYLYPNAKNIDKLSYAENNIIDMRKMKDLKLIDSLNYSLSTDDSSIKDLMIMNAHKRMNAEEEGTKTEMEKKLEKRVDSFDGALRELSKAPWGVAFPIEGSFTAYMLKIQPSTPFSIVNARTKAINGSYMFVKSVSYTFSTTTWQTEVEFTGIPTYGLLFEQVAKKKLGGDESNQGNQTRAKSYSG